MDSFLEEPRAIPRPTPIIQEIQAPTVPEVSLMFQNQRKEKTPLPVNYGKSVQSYNAWKLRNNSNNAQEYDSFLLTNTNKENLSTDKSLLSKKQVRFESPVSHYSISKQNVRKETSPLTENNFKGRYSAGNCSPTSNSFKQTEKKLESPKNIQRQTYKDVKNVKEREPAKSFEKLYMSNLPNRELDLSFLEPQKNPCGSIRAPTFSAYKPTMNTYSVSTKTYDYNDSFKTYSQKFNRISSDIRTESPRKNIQNEPESIQTQNNDIISKINEIKAQNENKSEEIINTSSTSIEKNDCDEKHDCDNKKTESSESKTNETVTVSDLLTIIKLQNEQLQKLQTQVEKLVKLNEEKLTEKPIEKQPKTTENQNKNRVIMQKDQQVGTTFNESHETSEQRNDNGKKISVGLMTSFEVTYKPPIMKKKYKKQRNLQRVDDEESQNSVYEYVEQYPKQYRSRANKKYERKNKIDFQRYQQERQHYEPEQQDRQHLNWNYRQTNETEYSLGSRESLEIQEAPESPENSIHIDMQEYDTDSSDDECSTDEGWTFYKDILGQVNNLLENSPHPSYKPRNEIAKKYDEVYTDTTLEQIKLATMKRLQNDGFVHQNGDQVQIKPTEVSFAVKQILMKYLPDDGLANVAAKNNPEEYKNDTRKPTDISVTAFKYMQQCNVTNAQQYYGSKGKNIMKKSVPKNDPKILDITTLKQQPKFL